ncbi:ankyrin repeat domain-containing protein [Chitinophaga sp. Cy-1792]|uniref:ankyrin repeat domain-containing protein n=1 Tax=Chitinophaga sp. Cy-1792 TaxID=2608339 RepID=UPI0014241544|nr:ankyrin repeat domain-containing protein [Chitinophaga sp. Cy-1792]NIG55772.1 ankyrin repeat domain-containing protein [Chitinophaga sp. Cy-1792]
MKTILLLLTLSLPANGGKPITVNYMEQQTPETLIEQVSRNQLQAVEKALQGGANVNTKDEKGHTLLLLAVHGRQYEMAKLLVTHGADVNMQDEILDSPFLFAGATGQNDMLELFLAHGARFDVFNRYGGSALIPACERGHVETVRLLANTKGFPVDHINRLGWTGLLEAIILGDGSSKYQEIVAILKAAGSDMHIADGRGVTPLQHAQQAGYTAIIKILEAN